MFGLSEGCAAFLRVSRKEKDSYYRATEKFLEKNRTTGNGGMVKALRTGANGSGAVVGSRFLGFRWPRETRDKVMTFVRYSCESSHTNSRDFISQDRSEKSELQHGE